MAELRNHWWPDSAMKVLVIYDGCQIAARAIAILADTTVQWSIRFWQLNSLSLPPAAERALVEAAGAQLILLAGRRVRALPAFLRSWLEQWATRRQIENAALAVMSDEPNAAFSAFVPFELSEFAGQPGLSFTAEDGPAVERCSTAAGYLEESGLPKGL